MNVCWGIKSLKDKGPSINDVTPKIGFFDPPPSLCHPMSPLAPLPLRGDVTLSPKPLPFKVYTYTKKQNFLRIQSWFSRSSKKVIYLWTKTLISWVFFSPFFTKLYLFESNKIQNHGRLKCNFSILQCILRWRHLIQKWGPSLCHPKSPFGVTPSLPYRGDVIYGWSLSTYICIVFFL